MSRLRGFRARLRAILGKTAADRDFDEEIQGHIEMETEKNLRLGLPLAEARRRAMVAFGGVQIAKEAHRDGRGARWFEELVADVRFALRTLRRSPALAGAAIITLAVGIGANTAIFSVVNAVILRPLPFAEAGRLMMLSEENAEKGWHHAAAAPANVFDWRQRVTSFQEVAAYTDGVQQLTLTGEGAAKLVRAVSVTGNFFSVLEIPAARGRVFEDRETWATGTRVAVISQRLWRDQFGSQPKIEGRTVELDGQKTQIVGVVPEGFGFPSADVDLWVPSAWNPNDRSQVWFRRAHWLRVIARLKPGVPFSEAAAEFQGVVRRLQLEYPLTNKVMGADMTPLKDFLIDAVRQPLLVLQGAVILLLLIACANVGNLLLVQAAGRGREAALRLTLGAGRGRLVRQAVTESLVLSTIGGTIGVVVGWGGTKALAALQPAGMLPVPDIGIEWRVVLYGLAVAIASGLIFGIAPVVWQGRRVPAEVMKEGGRTGSEGRRLRRWGDGLAVAEIALALLLTVGAGLLVRSFARLQAVDPGFEATGVLAVGANFAGPRYDSDAKLNALHVELIQRLKANPGVETVGIGLIPPLMGAAWTSDFHIEGRPADDYGSEVAHESVSPDYFAALRIPLKAGRVFTAADQNGSANVVVINDALARKHFGSEDPVGQRMVDDRVPESTSVWRTIVGVVGSVRQRSLALEPMMEMITPLPQAPNSYVTTFLRTRGDPASLGPAVRAAFAQLDPNVAISVMETMTTVQARSVATQRFLMLLLLAFASTGLLLAVVGVYGVIAQLAHRRTREMGIRVALGARSEQVQWLVVRRGLELLVFGAVVGTAGALAGTRAMGDLLFEVRPADPLTFGVVTGVLALAALAASWLPARRASRTDPAEVLRAD